MRRIAELGSLNTTANVVKFVAKLFPAPKRKQNVGLPLSIKSRQALAVSVVVFLMSLWPLLTVPLGRPTSWFGDFLFLLCATVSVFAPATLFVVTGIDIIRQRADARVVGACAISLSAVAATAAFIYLQIAV